MYIFFVVNYACDRGVTAATLGFWTLLDVKPSVKLRSCLSPSRLFSARSLRNRRGRVQFFAQSRPYTLVTKSATRLRQFLQSVLVFSRFLAFYRNTYPNMSSLGLYPSNTSNCSLPSRTSVNYVPPSPASISSSRSASSSTYSLLDRDDEGMLHLLVIALAHS